MSEHLVLERLTAEEKEEEDAQPGNQRIAVEECCHQEQGHEKRHNTGIELERIDPVRQMPPPDLPQPSTGQGQGGEQASGHYG